MTVPDPGGVNYVARTTASKAQRDDFYRQTNELEDPPMWRVVLHRNIRSGVTHWHADRPELHGIKEEIQEPNGPKTFVFSKTGIYTLPVDQRPTEASGDLDVVHVIVDHEVAGCLLAVQNILETERATLGSAHEQWRGTVWEHLRAQDLFG